MTHAEKKRLEQEISNFVARVLKEDTGRGTMKNEVFINTTNVLIISSGFMLPIELELCETEGGCSQVRSNRLKWIEARRQDYVNLMAKVIHKKVTGLYFDFNPRNNTRVLVFTFE